MKLRGIMVALLAIACLTVSALGGVREGMTREEVLELRGEPRARIAQDNLEYMEFGDGLEVELRDGRVTYSSSTDDAADEPATDTPRERPAWTESEAVIIRETTAQFGEFTFDGDFDDSFTQFLLALVIGMALLSLLTLVAMWKVFNKAGEPGWAILIPIYNLIVMLRIAGKPAWWFLLFCIPLVQIVVAINVDVCTARRFGKGVGCGLGLLFLPMIFYPILAFGSATYEPNT